ncbi:hypothetical protein K7432_006368 [Basidiobolus ranarum]|uniref:Uncharacterized protein n=1 Tax=Basidiobolus ranarum TaxID=34480 RepID=A0ABR2W1R8_9FUNG
MWLLTTLIYVTTIVITTVIGDQITIANPLPYSVIVASRPFNITLELEVSGGLHTPKIQLDILTKDGKELYTKIHQFTGPELLEKPGNVEWAFPIESPEEHYTIRASGDAEYTSESQVVKVHMERQIRVFVQRPLSKPSYKLNLKRSR